MRLWIGLVLVVLGLALFSRGIPHDRKATGEVLAEEKPRPTTAAADSRAPVLVELFTSEGCSSCPPADALLARLRKTQPIAGAQVIALKEHVDYWNHLGWRDPYSSAQFTERQNDYAQAQGLNQVYTPQMIVDGRAEFVGSSQGAAQRAISEAARVSKASVHLEWKPVPDGGDPALAIRVERLIGASPGDTPEVYLALTEDNLHSDVLRGENAGSSFDHIAVVRDLRRFGTANSAAAVAFEVQAAVKIADAWKRENLRAVVFVQESHSRHILAAGEAPLLSR